MMKPDSGSQPRAYLRSEAVLTDMKVSPGGDFAAYMSEGTGEAEIYVRSFPDPRAEMLVSTGGGNFPHWSPDGQHDLLLEISP